VTKTLPGSTSVPMHAKFGQALGGGAAGSREPDLCDRATMGVLQAILPKSQRVNADEWIASNGTFFIIYYNNQI